MFFFLFVCFALSSLFSHSIHSAAKNWESAAQCARDLKRHEDSVQYSKRSSQLYVESGNAEKAAEVLTKASRHPHLLLLSSSILFVLQDQLIISSFIA